MTTENNKIIAEFMNPKLHMESQAVTQNLFKYHSDWNWLMEVVDKIYEMDLYYDKYIDYNSSMFSNGKLNLATRIDRVYEQVIEFINWYNQNK